MWKNVSSEGLRNQRFQRDSFGLCLELVEPIFHRELVEAILNGFEYARNLSINFGFALFYLPMGISGLLLLFVNRFLVAFDKGTCEFWCHKAVFETGKNTGLNLMSMN